MSKLQTGMESKAAGFPTLYTAISHSNPNAQLSLLWQQTYCSGEITNTSGKAAANNQLLKKVMYQKHYSRLFFLFFLLLPG